MKDLIQKICAIFCGMQSCWSFKQVSLNNQKKLLDSEFQRKDFEGYDDEDKIIQRPFPLLLTSLSNDELYQYLTTKKI